MHARVWHATGKKLQPHDQTETTRGDDQHHPRLAARPHRPAFDHTRHAAAERGLSLARQASGGKRLLFSRSDGAVYRGTARARKPRRAIAGRRRDVSKTLVRPPHRPTNDYRAVVLLAAREGGRHTCGGSV